MARQYNNIYTKLVEGEYDMVGHVAYSLYKADKAQYIEKFKTDKGREPTEEELRHFHDSSCLSGAIKRYQASAVELLKSFLDETLLETARQTEKECHENFEEHIRSACSSLAPLSKKRRYWENVVSSVVGAFLFAIIIAAIAFVIQFKGADFRLSVKSDVQTTEVELIPTQQQANN